MAKKNSGVPTGLYDDLRRQVDIRGGSFNAHAAASCLGVDVVSLCGAGKPQKALKAVGLCLRYRDGFYQIEKLG